ncbi:hypothetical protein RD110_04725 [Rhodoferax koreense]|uniref:Uncharacterized protein n=1 Tax=Rhodoferax koreensis TaxID=1842727 RepID=A0A1P8JS74_9BURK|nr:hypothetical protein [Rhodoferax koreense]APW36596.1 hypothetical protein RD110_04725 [Rhodoferax koreense]
MKNLNKIIVGAALAAAAAVPALAQNVGISIGVNQPGVYGRIDIGNAPPPMLVYPQPVIIQQPPQRLPRQPIYLYVPPAQQQNWGRYCNNYSACNQPVYFVQEQWVRDRYVQAHPGWRPGGRNDRWDDRRGPPGHAYGHDKDKHGRGHDKHDRDRGRHGGRDD